MPNFIKFRDAVNEKINQMENSDSGLFLSHVNKSEIWETYLGSFSEENNPIYLENTVHDCNCCKDFIRDLGRAVAINSKNEIETCWDIDIDDKVYQDVADALAAYVRKQSVASVYMATSYSLNNKENFSDDPLKLGKFSHFYYKLGRKYSPSANAGSEMGISRNNFNVLKRGLSELTVEALENIALLIEDNNLYLGEQNQKRVTEFLNLKKQYDKVAQKKKDNFVWRNISNHISVVLFRNSAVGTLAVDLSEGKDLESAVTLYEHKTAPDNYKRSKSVVTKQMILKAQDTVEELGLQDSLERRHASLGDITINNVLWADKKTTAKLNDSVFDVLLAEAPEKVKPKDGIDIGLLEFTEQIVPTAKSIQVYLEAQNLGNMISLVAPVHPEAPKLMKWDNNFSWSYNGNMTDSVKSRVASKGGNVTGDLRVSLSWFNTDDLDIHMETPRHGRIYHSRRAAGAFSLDVDMNISSDKATTDAVENISAKSISQVAEGDYQVFVKNFTKRNTENAGYDIEVEFLGEVYNFSMPTSPRDSDTDACFTFNYSKANGISFKDVHMNKNTSSSEFWGLGTNKFHNVKSVMFSPNHWDENKSGNRHLFFMIDGCTNPEPVRGFYNEYLIDSLHNNRKVFEVLASKMKAEPTPDQLSGLGFSTTKRGDVIQLLVESSQGTKLYRVQS